MRLTFTKRKGRYDDLRIDRAGGATESITCPKQGIIPHDMVHFAVESVLQQRGFLALVAEGRPAAFDTIGEAGDESVERLVETFQAELWGNRVATAELIETYRHACEARGHQAALVSAEEIERIRDRLDQLSAQWTEVPVDGSMSVELTDRPGGGPSAA